MYYHIEQQGHVYKMCMPIKVLVMVTVHCTWKVWFMCTTRTNCKMLKHDWALANIGPYSGKRNNFMVHILEKGITLVQEYVWLQRLNFLLLLIASYLAQLKTMNKVWISIENRGHFHFTIIPLCIPFQKQQENINKSIHQTYSWNKDGLKVFLFWECRPL